MSQSIIFLGDHLKFIMTIEQRNKGVFCCFRLLFVLFLPNIPLIIHSLGNFKIKKFFGNKTDIGRDNTMESFSRSYHSLYPLSPSSCLDSTLNRRQLGTCSCPSAGKTPGTLGSMGRPGSHILVTSKHTMKNFRQERVGVNTKSQQQFSIGQLSPESLL